eukprot:gene8768-18136_t
MKPCNIVDGSQSLCLNFWEQDMCIKCVKEGGQFLPSKNRRPKKSVRDRNEVLDTKKDLAIEAKVQKEVGVTNITSSDLGSWTAVVKNGCIVNGNSTLHYQYISSSPWHRNDNNSKPNVLLITDRHSDIDVIRGLWEAEVTTKEKVGRNSGTATIAITVIGDKKSNAVDYNVMEPSPLPDMSTFPQPIPMYSIPSSPVSLPLSPESLIKLADTVRDILLANTIGESGAGGGEGERHSASRWLVLGSGYGATLALTLTEMCNNKSTDLTSLSSFIHIDRTILIDPLYRYPYPYYPHTLSLQMWRYWRKGKRILLQVLMSLSLWCFIPSPIAVSDHPTSTSYPHLALPASSNAVQHNDSVTLPPTDIVLMVMYSDTVGNDNNNNNTKFSYKYKLPVNTILSELECFIRVLRSVLSMFPQFPHHIPSLRPSSSSSLSAYKHLPSICLLKYSSLTALSRKSVLTMAMAVNEKDKDMDKDCDRMMMIEVGERSGGGSLAPLPPPIVVNQSSKKRKQSVKNMSKYQLPYCHLLALLQESLIATGI